MKEMEGHGNLFCFLGLNVQRSQVIVNINGRLFKLPFFSTNRFNGLDGLDGP